MTAVRLWLGVIARLRMTARRPALAEDAINHSRNVVLGRQPDGAVGLRIDNPLNVGAVRAVTELPLLGIFKQRTPGCDVYITPTFESARLVVEAGANIVALDATPRLRPHRETFAGIVRRVHDELGVPVMADVSTVDEAVAAARDGADVVATTLAGHTSYTVGGAGFNIELAAQMVAAVDVPVIVEGGLWTVDDVRASFDAGAFAVVVGSAVTAPELITRRLSAATPRNGNGGTE